MNTLDKDTLAYLCRFLDLQDMCQLLYTSRTMLSILRGQPLSMVEYKDPFKVLCHLSREELMAIDVYFTTILRNFECLDLFLYNFRQELQIRQINSLPSVKTALIFLPTERSLSKIVTYRRFPYLERLFIYVDCFRNDAIVSDINVNLLENVQLKSVYINRANEIFREKRTITGLLLNIKTEALAIQDIILKFNLQDSFQFLTRLRLSHVGYPSQTVILKLENLNWLQLRFDNEVRWKRLEFHAPKLVAAEVQVTIVPELLKVVNSGGEFKLTEEDRRLSVEKGFLQNMEMFIMVSLVFPSKKFFEKKRSQLVLSEAPGTASFSSLPDLDHTSFREIFLNLSKIESHPRFPSGANISNLRKT